MENLNIRFTDETRFIRNFNTLADFQSWYIENDRRHQSLEDRGVSFEDFMAADLAQVQGWVEAGSSVLLEEI